MNFFEFIDSVKSLAKEDFLRYFPNPFLVSSEEHIGKSKQPKNSDLAGGMQYREFATRSVQKEEMLLLQKWLQEKHIFLLKNKLGQKIVNLGRTPNNDIILDFATISKLHCCFFLYDLQEVFICDCGSTNGTSVNSQLLEKEKKVLLKNSDIICLGNVIKLVFYAAEDLWNHLDGLNKQ